MVDAEVEPEQQAKVPLVDGCSAFTTRSQLFHVFSSLLGIGL